MLNTTLNKWKCHPVIINSYSRTKVNKASKSENAQLAWQPASQQSACLADPPKHPTQRTAHLSDPRGMKSAPPFLRFAAPSPAPSLPALVTRLPRAREAAQDGYVAASAGRGVFRVDTLQLIFDEPHAVPFFPGEALRGRVTLTAASDLVLSGLELSMRCIV